MTFTLHHSVDGDLRRDWHALAADVGSRFASRPSYGLAWHAHLARGPLRVAAVRRDDRLVALLPLHERRRLGVRVYRLLGHGLGTIGEALATDPEALSALVAGLAGTGAVLQLTHLPGDSPLVTAVAADPGWDSTFTEDDHCPVIDLPVGTRASDLRSKSTLSRAASTRRKLAREGGELEIETTRTPEELQRRWPDIVRTAAAAGSTEDEDRLNLCASPYDAFTLDFLRQEAEDGHLLVWGASFAGTWGAHFATLRTGGTAELWFTRFDPEYRRVRPGHHLLEAVCDQHDDLGVVEVDLLLGRSGYKSDWQTREYPVGTLTAVPAGARTVIVRMNVADRAVDLLRSGAATARRSIARARGVVPAVNRRSQGPSHAEPR